VPVRRTVDPVIVGGRRVMIVEVRFAGEGERFLSRCWVDVSYDLRGLGEE